MVEMHLENDRVERLRLRKLGEDWILAVMEKDFARLALFCHPDAVSHLLTPRRYVDLDTCDGLVEKFRQWFEACSQFSLEHSRIEMVGERLGIFYRFFLQEDGGWFVVEQHLYCTLREGQIAHLHLLCSGFQPVAENGQAVLQLVEPEARAASRGDALLEIHSGASQSGSTCAVLTPAMKSKLREMLSGQVLEVHVDDPSAREDIEAWCRLSGNRLLEMSERPGQDLWFFIQKK